MMVSRETQPAMAEQLISINEAATQGIERLRRPKWADPLDHAKIDIFEGRSGPWLHLWCPFNKECNGRDPVDVLLLAGARVNALQADPDERGWLPYTGPLPDSDEYKAAVARCAGVLGERPRS